MEVLIEFLLYQPWWAIYVVVFGVLVACGLGFPMPEDIILFTMGYFAYNGLADLNYGILVCLAGVLIGDSVIYFLGYHVGSKLTQRQPFSRLLTAERMGRAQSMFHRWGNRVILAARFMPGLRAPTYFSAGTLKLPYRVFIGYDFLASMVSVPALVYVMYRFGGQVDKVIKWAHQVQGGIALLITAVVGAFLLKHFVFKKKPASPIS
jgi:membrane protein DedA with SNARE-associated domain